MVNAEDMREWIDQNRKFAVFSVVFLAVQLYIVFRTWSKPLIWDASIYTAMGKNLFSMGQYGLWEVFRPPMLPILAGIQWVLNIPALGYSRLVSVLVSFGVLSTVYIMTKDIAEERTAVLATALMAATFVFSRHASVYLTGIPSSGLVMLSLYLLWKKKPIYGGIAGGMAFLTRFPAALVGPAAIAYLLILVYRHRDYRKFFVDAGKYTGGFMALALTYFGLNAYFFGNPLAPIIRGALIPTANVEQYLYGLFYMVEAIKVNPLLLMALPGIYYLYRSDRDILELLGPAFAVFYGFFTVYPHKEGRFLLLFLPMLSVFSAAGIKYVVDRFETEIDLDNVVYAAVLVGVVVSGFMTLNIMTPVDQDAVNYYSAHSGLEGLVASNDATIMAYGDFSYLPLPPPTLNSSYDTAKQEADYLSLNSCAWYCTAEIDSCAQRFASLRQDAEQNFPKTFELNTSTCNYRIYRIGGQN